MERFDCQLRPATLADIDTMIQLLAQLCVFEQDFNCDQEKQKQGLELLLNQSDSHVLVAETEGQVVAMCTMQRMVSTEEGGYVG